MDAVLWCLAGGGRFQLFPSPSVIQRYCYRDKDFVTSVKVEVKTITRHQRRENGRRIDNFAIKKDEKNMPPPCVDAQNSKPFLKKDFLLSVYQLHLRTHGWPEGKCSSSSMFESQNLFHPTSVTYIHDENST